MNNSMGVLEVETADPTNIKERLGDYNFAINKEADNSKRVEISDEADNEVGYALYRKRENQILIEYYENTHFSEGMSIALLYFIDRRMGGIEGIVFELGFDNKAEYEKSGDFYTTPLGKACKEFGFTELSENRSNDGLSIFYTVSKPY